MTGTRHGFGFQNLHRNKRSLTLNLKSEIGKTIFLKLAETADVVVENFRSQVKFGLGIDYEAVRKVNPRVVYGQYRRLRPGWPLWQTPSASTRLPRACRGLMSITRPTPESGSGAGRSIPICDLTAQDVPGSGHPHGVA